MLDQPQFKFQNWRQPKDGLDDTISIIFYHNDHDNMYIIVLSLSLSVRAVADLAPVRSVGGGCTVANRGGRRSQPTPFYYRVYNIVIVVSYYYSHAIVAVYENRAPALLGGERRAGRTVRASETDRYSHRSVSVGARARVPRAISSRAAPPLQSIVKQRRARPAYHRLAIAHTAVRGRTLAHALCTIAAAQIFVEIPLRRPKSERLRPPSPVDTVPPPYESSTYARTHRSRAALATTPPAPPPYLNPTTAFTATTTTTTTIILLLQLLLPPP